MVRFRKKASRSLLSSQVLQISAAFSPNSLTPEILAGDTAMQTFVRCMGQAQATQREVISPSLAIPSNILQIFDIFGGNLHLRQRTQSTLSKADWREDLK